MAEANITQGFMVHAGLYRMPDLLTEDQTIEYFKETYGVKLTFEHLNPAGDHGSDLGPTGQEVVPKEETTTPPSETPKTSETTSPVTEAEEITG